MGLKIDLTKFKNEFKSVLTDLSKTIVHYAPELWAGTGIGLMLGSGVLAVVETPKVVEELKTDKNLMTNQDKVKIYAKYYTLPVVGAISGAGCVVMSVSTSNRRYVALASAYQFADETFRAYKNQVLETIGQKKEKEIEGKVAQKRLDDHPVTKSEVIVTGRGKSLCYDAYSGRYFEYDIGKIQKVENEINNRMMQENYVALNELYLELGLEPIDAGFDMGWSIDDGKLLELELSSKLTKDSEPCLVISYDPLPKSEYYMLYK